MTRELLHHSAFAAIATLLLINLALPAHAQTVAMSGEYGESASIVYTFPLNPPKLPCTTSNNARCHPASRNGMALTPSAAPSSGVPVAGAGVIIAPGALTAGGDFTIPTGAFRQARGKQAAPIFSLSPFFQVETDFSYYAPASARAVNPQSQTRMFQANAWNAPGNGQTGRVAATTTPISGQTQTEHNITVRYKAGLNAFGGTMASLRDGFGDLAYRPFLATFGSSFSSAPWIARRSLGAGINGAPVTVHGAGWNYTAMLSRGPDVAHNFGGVGPPCTSVIPPSPVGCGIVTDSTGTAQITYDLSALSTRFNFAWTTGTVEVLRTGSFLGFPRTQILTAMGYDTVSTTNAGGSIRNIGLVAGSFTKRDLLSVSGSETDIHVIGLDLRFTPEPAKTASLIIGLGMVALLASPKRSHDV